MFLPSVLLLSAALVRSLETNRTVDDEQQNSEDGILLSYSPSANVWSQGARCSGCGVNTSNVDLQQVHDGTWHDGTYRPGGGPLTITVGFTGTAVYVYNILANNVLPTITFTNISFYLDGRYVGQFIHAPDDSSTMQYNALVYHDPGLANAPHTLLMSASGADISLILFDYLVYTVDDSSPGSPSSTVITATATSPSPSPPRTSLSDSTSVALSGTVTSIFTELTSPPTTKDALTPTSDGDVPSNHISEDLTLHTTTTYLTTSSISAPTAVASTSSAPARNGSALSPGSTAGVALGCIVLLVLLCSVFWFRRRLQRRSAQKIGARSSGELDEDIDGLPSRGFCDPGRPCDGTSRRRGPAETAPSYSSGAFATLGASVHELGSDRTLVMREPEESVVQGKQVSASTQRIDQKQGLTV